MDTLKFTCFFNFVETNRGTSLIGGVFISCDHQKPRKRATVSLIKVKSCNALLRMLLLCFRSYLTSVLRYKFLILDTCHPDALYLREQGCEDPWLFFEAKRGPRANKFWKHCLRGYNIK